MTKLLTSNNTISKLQLFLVPVNKQNQISKVVSYKTAVMNKNDSITLLILPTKISNTQCTNDCRKENYSVS